MSKREEHRSKWPKAAGGGKKAFSGESKPAPMKYPSGSKPRGQD